jgi:transposase
VPDHTSAIYQINLDELTNWMFEEANRRQNLPADDPASLSRAGVSDMFGFSNSTFRRMQQRKENGEAVFPDLGRKGPLNTGQIKKLSIRCGGF